MITAAALAEFAARGVDVAVVEAGLGGRLDATNVLAQPRRPADERRPRAHRRARRDAGGDRRGEACSRAGGDDSGPARPRVRGSSRGRTSSSAARARRRRRSSAARSRARRRSRCPAGSSGAATSSGTARTTRTGRAGSSGTLPPADYVVVRLDPRDKDVDAMLAALPEAGTTLVATTSSNARALAGRGARRARGAVLRARRGRRRPTRRSGARARARRARSSSPARSTCWPIFRRHERLRWRKGAVSASVLRFAVRAVVGVHRRARVRGWLYRRES